MNECEIDEAVRVLGYAGSDLYPYACYLSKWRDIINLHSDGWPYWTVGSRAAEKLCVLLTSAVHVERGYSRDSMPTVGEARKTLTPIKAAAARHGLPQPSVSGI